MVIETVNMPCGWSRLMTALYAPSQSYVGRHKCASRKIFSVAAGVSQGCPLAGSAFVLCIESMIRLLIRIVSAERVFGFADDLAIILPSLDLLPRVRDAFRAFERTSGLRLRLS